MSTSGTYNFCSPQSRVLIDDAYERIGITRPLIDREKILSAQSSINFILQHWPNQGKTLWSIREAMISLQTNLNTYSLPSNAIDLKTVTLRSSSRNVFSAITVPPTAGVAASSAGGIAANAFDGNSSTACTQNAINGNISYTWNAILSANDVCASQNVVFLVTPNLILDGNLSTGAPYASISFGSSAKAVSVTSVNNLAAVNFTITGTYNGLVQAEIIAGPNNTNVYTTKLFNTITSVTASADANAVSVGSSPASNTVAISLVGIQSNTTQTYTLVCEYSTDGITWPVANNALTIPAQSYPNGIAQWFAITIPTDSVSFRVRETGGATLNIQELYFNNNVQDVVIGRFSESDYMSQIMKNQVGRPSSFYVDRQVTPILKLWPAPSSQYQVLYVSYWISLQDVGAMTDVAEVPARFLEALCSALAYKLAIKNRETVPIEDRALLASDAKEAFIEATTNDRERVVTRIYPETGYSYE